MSVRYNIEVETYKSIRVIKKIRFWLFSVSYTTTVEEQKDVSTQLLEEESLQTIINTLNSMK